MSGAAVAGWPVEGDWGNGGLRAALGVEFYTFSSFRMSSFVFRTRFFPCLVCVFLYVYVSVSRVFVCS